MNVNLTNIDYKLCRACHKTGVTTILKIGNYYNNPICLCSSCRQELFTKLDYAIRRERANEIQKENERFELFN